MEYDVLDSWERSLRARARSPRTIESYLTDLRSLAKAAAPTALEAVDRRTIEAFLASLNDRGRAPATIARHYRSFQQFFGWLQSEDEIDTNPMEKMKPPRVPVQPPPLVSPAELAKLLAACDTPRVGTHRPKSQPPTKATFENKRDKALILILSSTGVRAGELMGLTIADVDMRSNTFVVLGKGGRRRIVALMPKAAEALDRYLRERRRHRKADLPQLWLGDKGALSISGLGQMVERRCLDAGIAKINPHRFRHTFAHEAKARGMSDGDLMSIAGWNSPAMLHRYGASAAAERAREAHHRLFGSDG